MPHADIPPTAARALLARLELFGPAAADDDLVLDLDPPAELARVAAVLHTGVRAVLTGRKWYGCDGRTGRVYALDPGQPIPAGITLLCVEGDRRWDRTHPGARLDHPRLFGR
jgi:hypothetical protein